MFIEKITSKPVAESFVIELSITITNGEKPIGLMLEYKSKGNIHIVGADVVMHIPQTLLDIPFARRPASTEWVLEPECMPIRDLKIHSGNIATITQEIFDQLNTPPLLTPWGPALGGGLCRLPITPYTLDRYEKAIRIVVNNLNQIETAVKSAQQPAEQSCSIDKQGTATSSNEFEDQNTDDKALSLNEKKAQCTAAVPEHLAVRSL